MSKDALRAAATGSAAEPPKTIFQYLDDARVKQGIAAVAGTSFYRDPIGETILRFCFAKDDAVLVDAAARLRRRFT